ncbi:hypothetical protein [Niallia circulans]|uniref:hypothetical protein n=1 Tax=Niallia circulans TaxID=1397 RepID=UPI0026EEA821|nr:hypothetical protein [Niallia circulans]
MEMTVIFKIGEIEIKTVGNAPDNTSMPEEGKKNMAVLSAMSKIKSETGLDLYELDEDINEKAEVIIL